MTNLIWLIFAHFIGDIALQSDWQANNKGKYWYVMLSHCMIWTGCICIALQFLGIFAMWKVLFLLIGHWVSDYIKAKQPKRDDTWWMIYPDQAWHGIQCFIVYVI